EAAFVIRLERLAARAHQPRAVLQLRLDQERDATPVGLAVGRQSAGLAQDDQRTARGVGVAVELVELAPAAVVALRLEQFLRGGLQFLAWGARLAERPQPEDAVLGVFGRRLEQPGADGLDALGDALLLLRGAPFAHAAQRDVGRGERAGLRRRPVAGRAPVVEILVVDQQILDDGLGRVVG